MALWQERKANVTGDAYENALYSLRVARSHYRAAVTRAKGVLLRKTVERLEKEGPWSPIYHEFKANRKLDIAYISNIKINNTHTVGVEETTGALLNALIPDDSVADDNDYHRDVRNAIAVLPESPVSSIPSLDEFYDIVNSLPLNKASGEDKISNKMIKAACKTAGTDILNVFTRCISEGVFPSIWRRGFIKIIPNARADKCRHKDADAAKARAEKLA
ncbi:uncharacterized protein LOC114353273 [Ostrinia furnacalis]|uniref:uncharacterized protein LOC114353273 n=1 Tax=Ostrinia furnacalis TaxID=93504 RepID=UPI00103FB4A1|nr:uncharacterized protein LOC114353273 [Ostrinia furnacalis]